MRRSDTLGWSQVKIGLMLLAGFVILLWVAFNSQLPAAFRSEEELSARFASADGLVTGAPIFFLGMEAGAVQSVTFEPENAAAPILVRLAVKEQVYDALRADAVVRIASLGFLGEKHVELVQGAAPEPLPEDAVLRGGAQSELADLIEPGQRTLTRLDSLLLSVQEIAAGVQRGEGSVGKLLSEDELHGEMLATLGETRRTMAEFRRTQAAVGAQLASTAQSFDSLAVALRTGDGTLARLREDPSLYENLDGAAVRLERVLAQVETGDGLMSRALRDPELADQFTRLVVDLRALLQDMRENPGRYVQFSVF